MIDFSKIKLYLWYINRVRYLNSFKRHSEFILDYFDRVRRNEPFREHIGTRDLKMALLPRANPKKKQHTMGSSIPVAQQILSELPKEYEKLERWKRITNGNYKSSKAKIRFNNGKEFKLSI